MDGVISQWVFYLAGVGVVFYGVLVAILLLSSKSSYKLANRMLALIILIGIWYVTAAILVISGKFVEIASVFRIGLPFFYAAPPLIYWYVKARMDRNFRIKPLGYLHLIPVGLTIIDSVPYHLLSPEQKVLALQSMTEDLRNIMHVQTGLVPDFLHFFIRPFHGVVYTALAAIHFKNAMRDKRMRKEIESQHNLKKWFYIFISFFSLIYIGLFAVNVIWVTLPYKLETLSNISLIPSILTLSFFLAIHVFLFFNINVIFGKELKPIKSSVSIPDDKILPIAFPKEVPFTDIDRLIIDKEIFKNPKITAPEIASMLGMAPHTFSSVLNNQYGKRFPDFINTYRINYVIAELSKGTSGNMSIEGIANEAGFASRSAFYTSFKKNTGLTPSEYLKKNNPS